jgi:hypothetical protein
MVVSLDTGANSGSSQDSDGCFVSVEQGVVPFDGFNLFD